MPIRVAVLNRSNVNTSDLRRAVQAAAGVAGAPHMTLSAKVARDGKLHAWFHGRGQLYISIAFPLSGEIDRRLLAWKLVACCRAARGVRYRDLTPEQRDLYPEAPAWIVANPFRRLARPTIPSPRETRLADALKATRAGVRSVRRLGDALDELLD